MTYKRKNFADRFWSKVSKHTDDQCWLWCSNINSTGYGTIGHADRGTLKAHRVAYELTYGDIPSKLLVLHHCDNRACVNPKHLFLGTHQDNATDKVNKDRQLKGVSIKQAKLTPASVREIRTLHSTTNISCRDLAKRFSVSTRLIRAVCSRTVWRHVD